LSLADAMAGAGAQSAPNDLIALGRIVAAYGVRGWVKVQPFSATTETLRKAPIWWLSKLAGAPQKSLVAPTFTSHKVVGARTQGSTVVAQLENIDDRDAAESLIGLTVNVSKALFPPARHDEYYWVDLEACAVFDTHNQSLIGRVLEVLDNGAHAILRVQRLMAVDPDQLLLDAKGRPLELLVPFVAEHVQGVDIQAKKIETDWPVDF